MEKPYLCTSPESSNANLPLPLNHALSHYGPSHENKTCLFGTSTRRTIRRNFIARGLARSYGEQKAREESNKAQIPRAKKQQAILNRYNKQRIERLEDQTNDHDEVDSTPSDNEAENVILVLKSGSVDKRLATKRKKSWRTSGAIEPQRGVNNFPRHTSLRQLQPNQHEQEQWQSACNSDEIYNGVNYMNSPTKLDIKQFDQPECTPVIQSKNITPCTNDLVEKKKECSHPDAAVSSGKEALEGKFDKSTAQMLCELRIRKEIVMREHAVRQLHQVVPLLDSIGRELAMIKYQKTQAEAALTSVTEPHPRERRSSSSLTHPESGQCDTILAESEMKLLVKREIDLTEKVQHRSRQLKSLIESLQKSTMVIVESIVEWRKLRQQHRHFSNFQPLFRFPWKKHKIVNYLLHLDRDLRSLFPSAGLAICLGPNACYNPLLLPRKIVEELGLSDSECMSQQTFLTERSHNIRDIGGFSSSVNQLDGYQQREPSNQSEYDVSSYTALSTAVVGIENELTVNPPNNVRRVKFCIETVYQEAELERMEAQMRDEEAQRISEAYNPFSTIKAAGGVEEALANMLVQQAPHVKQLTQQLRLRQEDVSRVTSEMCSKPNKNPNTVVTHSSRKLHVNPQRLRNLLEKKNDIQISATDCELREIHSWGKKNKLHGQVIARKVNAKLLENRCARKIQQQFLAYQRRMNILHSLTHFISTAVRGIVDIQRIFRGFQTKKRFLHIKRLLDEQRRRHEAARQICHAFRRYKRCLRHRRSMTVESIAQAKLMSLQYQKLQEELDREEAAGHYRRVGEERRRQHLLIMQKRKLEQLELEQKRSRAATQIQTVMRAYLAKCEAVRLRKERKAHMTAVCAMAIQSKIRKFLKLQEMRRLRFHQDLERVNRSAVRIQSVYRGYNSRASLILQLDDAIQRALHDGMPMGTTEEKDDDNDSDDEDDNDKDETREKLPFLTISNTSRPASRSSVHDEGTRGGLHAMMAILSSPSTKKDASVKLTLPPLRPRAPSTFGILTKRQSITRRPSSLISSSNGTTKVELKLKETVIGDDF